MKFDVVVGNPPYNNKDTSRTGDNKRKQGVNLCKLFFFKSLELSKSAAGLIGPYGNRLDTKKTMDHFKKNGLLCIKNCNDRFNVSTNSIAYFIFDKTSPNEIVKNDFIKFDIPEKNINTSFHCQVGDLYRREFEHLLQETGKYKIYITTNICKYTSDEKIIRELNDHTCKKYRVAFNCNGAKNKIGKIIIAKPGEYLSGSINCVCVKSYDDAKKLKTHLQSESTNKILSVVKTGMSNSKKFLQYIPIPDDIKLDSD